jgi:hypothetical protein
MWLYRRMLKISWTISKPHYAKRKSRAVHIAGKSKRKERRPKEKNFLAEKGKNLVFHDNHRTFPSSCK